MFAEDFGYCMPGSVDDVHCVLAATPCPIAVSLAKTTPVAAPPPATRTEGADAPVRTSNHNLQHNTTARNGGATTANGTIVVKQKPANDLSSPKDSIWPWCSVPLAPADPILHSQTLLRADASGLAVDLSVGAYRDANGKATELRCIARASEILSEKPYTHAYLPLSGDPSLRTRSVSLVFGDSIPAKQVAVMQTISGSGALRLALEFCRKKLGATAALVSDPSWPNHSAMAAECGLKVRPYAYYNRGARSLRMDDMLRDLTAAPRGSAVILHACAHNPTGQDPTCTDWENVADVVVHRGLLPLFDLAYQGLASGDLDVDAWAIRMFVKRGIPVLVCQSNSKSMGLYNSRVGTLQIGLPGGNGAAVDATMSQLVWLGRASHSSPPAHGARLAATVLGDGELYAMWTQELREMTERIRFMRALLRRTLEGIDENGDWAFIERGYGMFVLLGMNQRQVEDMRIRWHVYLAPEGRLNVCGLTEHTVGKVASAIVSVLTAGSPKEA